MQACDEYLQPRRNFERKAKRPWITTGILHSIKKRDKMYKRVKKQPFNIQLREHFNSYKKIVRDLCRKSEKKYFETKFKQHHGNGRRTWDTINEALKRNIAQHNVPNRLKAEDDSIITDTNAICNLFNQYFTTIGQKLSEEFDDVPERITYDFRPQNTVESFFAITENQVKDCINALDTDKSPGLDNVHPKLLKAARDIVSKPLTHIFNLTISQGIIPQKLKDSRVLPIFKGSGSKDNPGNYRPISIISVCGKLLEKIIHNQIIQVIGDKCLYKFQYGFQRGLGTSDAIRELVDDLLFNLHEGTTSVGIFIDLKKAFDTVDHDILLEKMYGYGFRGVANTWLRNYLKGRSQTVKIQSSASLPLQLKVGVPQGSILGPLLFLLYINDIPECIHHGKLRLFADDTNVFYATKDPITMLNNIQEDTQRLESWLKRNKLTINASKSEYIVIKPVNKTIPDIPIYLQNSLLTRVDKVKYLGVFFDQHLTFKHHIEFLCKKISPIIGILGKVRWFLPKHICILLYKTLIHSQLAYCIESWGSASNFAFSPLERLQKKVLRFISHSAFDAHTAPIFHKLGILRVRELFFYKICIIVFKELRGLKVCTKYGFNRDNYSRETRSSTRGLLQIPHTTKLSNSLFKTLSHVGPRFYNLIPQTAKDTESISNFKNCVSNWLIETAQPIYTIMYVHR